tara:strand:- start:18 stop:701 length:684 start_codon:yes stop_codon:yes gene_type:complete
VLHSFLFYDGAIEFNLAKDTRFIIAHTNRYVVYEFWKCAMLDSTKLSEIAGDFFPVENKKMFQVYQDTFTENMDLFLRSALFFVLNQCSDNALVSSGALKNTECNPLNFSYLKNFSPSNFHLEFDNKDDFMDGIKKVDDEDYILLPIGRCTSNLFEEGKPAGIEEVKVYHKKIKEFFETTDKKVILLYYASPRVFKWYKDSNITMINKWGTKTNKRSECKEVLIANF